MFHVMTYRWGLWHSMLWCVPLGQTPPFGCLSLWSIFCSSSSILFKTWMRSSSICVTSCFSCTLSKACSEARNANKCLILQTQNYTHTTWLIQASQDTSMLVNLLTTAAHFTHPNLEHWQQGWDSFQLSVMEICIGTASLSKTLPHNSSPTNTTQAAIHSHSKYKSEYIQDSDLFIYRSWKGRVYVVNFQTELPSCERAALWNVGEGEGTRNL